MKTVTYAIDRDTGLVWSRLEGDRSVGDQKIAVPILEYDKIGEGGNFSQPLTYRLERMDITALVNARLRWTRKVPLETKNLHRDFWGMKPLPVSGEQ